MTETKNKKISHIIDFYTRVTAIKGLRAIQGRGLMFKMIQARTLLLRAAKLLL